MRKHLRYLLIFVFSIGVISNAYSQNITSGLVAWYKLDEASSGTCSGSSVLDSGGQGKTATCNSSPVYLPGKIGKGAINFNGSTQHLSVANDAVFNQTNNLTVAFWMKVTTNPGIGFPTVLAKGYDGTNVPYYFDFRGSLNGSAQTPAYLDFASYNGVLPAGALNTNVDFAQPGNDNVWYHIVGTFDVASGFILYFNGVSAATAAYTTPLPTTTLSLNMAALNATGTPSRFSPIVLDDIRVYNRTLTAQDVTALYQYTGNQLGFFKMSHTQGK